MFGFGLVGWFGFDYCLFMRLYFDLLMDCLFGDFRVLFVLVVLLWYGGGFVLCCVLV